MRIVKANLLLFSIVISGMLPAVVAYAMESNPGSDSSEYRVFANGIALPVYDTPIATVAQLTLTNRAELRVECKRDVKWVEVRPLRWGIRPKIAGTSFQFALTQPCKLSLELNGEFSRRPLFVFAEAPEPNPPQPGDKNLRYFPAGQHEIGAIEMKSGETVYLAAGAMVRGWIHAQDATNLRICGPGTLLGTGTTNMPGRRRLRFVHLQNCTNVVVEGVTLVDSPTWQVVPIGCENVTVRNVKIISDNGGDDGIDVVSSRKVRIADCFIRTKDDCIAIKSFAGPTNQVGTCDVDVSNSVFWNAAWGNGLEIGFELRATEVRDITFRNCDVIHVEDGAVFSIHNGDFATVRNVRFENIRVEDARQKLFDLAIFLTQYSLDRPNDPEERQRRYLNGAWDGVLSVSPAQQAEHSPHRGQIRDIVFKDIAVVDGQFPFSVISGFDAAHLVQNVTFQNLTVHGRKIRDAEKGKFFVEHTRNIRFK